MPSDRHPVSRTDPADDRVWCPACDGDEDEREDCPLAVAEALRSAVDAYDRGETYDDLPAIWDELMAGSKALRALDAKLREVLP